MLAPAILQGAILLELKGGRFPSKVHTLWHLVILESNNKSKDWTACSLWFFFMSQMGPVLNATHSPVSLQFAVNLFVLRLFMNKFLQPPTSRHLHSPRDLRWACERHLFLNPKPFVFRIFLCAWGIFETYGKCNVCTQGGQVPVSLSYWNQKNKWLKLLHDSTVLNKLQTVKTFLFPFDSVPNFWSTPFLCDERYFLLFEFVTSSVTNFSSPTRRKIDID